MANKKFLIVQANRDIGPYGPESSEFLRECFSLQYAAIKNGYEADIWGLRHSNFTNKPNFNEYDYIFVEEQYEFDWIPFEEIGLSSACKMQLCGDIHQHSAFYEWSHLFDIILWPIKTIIPEKKTWLPDKKHIWWPSAMDGRYYTSRNLPRIYECVWLGSSTRKHTNELKQEIGLLSDMRAGWNYIDTLASSKVALNSRGGGFDINYKTFEISGVGTCAVCDYDDMYVELGYKDGVNCYFFNNYEECKDKILFALKEDNWQSIGLEGYKESRNHTYEARFTRLKRILNDEITGEHFE